MKHQHESSINLLFKNFVKVLFAGVFAGGALVDAPHQPVEEPRIPLAHFHLPSETGSKWRFLRIPNPSIVIIQSDHSYRKQMHPKDFGFFEATQMLLGHKCLAIECRVFDEPEGSCIKEYVRNNVTNRLFFQCALISLQQDPAACWWFVGWMDPPASCTWEMMSNMMPIATHTPMKTSNSSQGWFPPLTLHQMSQSAETSWWSQLLRPVIVRKSCQQVRHRLSDCHHFPPAPNKHSIGSAHIWKTKNVPHICKP